MEEACEDDWPDVGPPFGGNMGYLPTPEDYHLMALLPGFQHRELEDEYGSRPENPVDSNSLKELLRGRRLSKANAVVEDKDRFRS